MIEAARARMHDFPTVSTVANKTSIKAQTIADHRESNSVDELESISTQLFG